MQPPATAPATLPSVVLRDRAVPAAVLRLMPLDVVRKYQVAAYDMDDEVLRMAIVYPEQLKQGFMTAINDLGRRLHRSVELFKTDPASMQALIKRYEALPPAAPTPAPAASTPAPAAAKPAVPTPAPAVTKPVVEPVAPATPSAKNVENPKPAVPASVTPPPRPAAPAPAAPKPSAKPPLFQVGKSIAYACLKRVPLAYAQQNRLVCVDFLAPNTYWFASDGSNEIALERIIPQIAESNKIKVERLTLKKGDIDDILAYYKRQSEKTEQQRQIEEEAASVTIMPASTEPRPKAEEEPLPAPKAPVAAPAAPATPPLQSEDPAEQGVTAVDENASIVTTENEQGGLAGFFQRVNLTLNPPKDVEETKAPLDALPPVEKPKLNAPDTGVSSRSVATPAPLVAAGPNQPAPEAGTPAPAAAPKPATTPVTQKTDDESGDIGKLLDKQVETVDELKEIIKKGFIPRIVAGVVSFAIHEKTSDIHIESFEDEVRVRYRIDGQLMDVVKLPPDVHAAMVSRIKILSKLRLDETRVPQDGRFDVNFNSAQVDLRVSLMPTVHGEKVVMRILDKSKGIASLDKLGIDGLAFENLTKAIQKPFGICLATGPTGSGKSTSLYAVLNRIATPNVNVVTLEDPVEYEMKGINQAQIRPKIGFTFAEGLRSILRQDPNIIMVGEIRDGETANMATQAALTGHLVLSTLHTNDAAGAVPRLTNMGIEPFLIASSVNVMMGQRLIRKICPDCRKEISLPPGFKAQIAEDIAKIKALNPLDAARIKEPLTFYQGMGCATCGGKGYQGRMGIYEVLAMSEAVEELTLQRASNEQIREAAQKEGMITMYQDGLIKVINGITTLDEVLRETSTG